MTNTSTPRTGISRFLNLLAAFSLLLVAGAASAQNSATVIYVETGGLDTRSGTAPEVNTGQVYQGRIVGPLRTISAALDRLDQPGYSNVTTISVAGGTYAEDVYIDDTVYGNSVDGISIAAREEDDNAQDVVNIQGRVRFAADNISFGSGTEGSFLIGSGNAADDGTNEGIPVGTDPLTDFDEDFTLTNPRLIELRNGSVDFGMVTYANDANVLVTGGRATGSVTPLGAVDLYYQRAASYTAGAELPAVLDYQSGQFSSITVQLNDGSGDPDETNLELRIPNGVRFTDGLGSATLDNFVYLFGDNDIDGEITVDGQVDFIAESQTGYLGGPGGETFFANFGDIVVNGEADFTLEGDGANGVQKIANNPFVAGSTRQVDSIDINGTLIIDGLYFSVLGDFDNDGTVVTDRAPTDGIADTAIGLGGDQAATFAPGPNFSLFALAIGNGEFTAGAGSEFQGDDKLVNFADDVELEGFLLVSEDAEAALMGEVITLSGEEFLGTSGAIINGVVSSDETGAIEFTNENGTQQFIAGQGQFSNLVVSGRDTPTSEFGPDLLAVPLGSFFLGTQFAAGGDTDLEFTGTIALATAGINILGETFFGTTNGADISPAENAAQTATILVVMTDPDQDTIIKSEPPVGALNLQGTFNFQNEEFSLNYQGAINNPGTVGPDNDADGYDRFVVGIEFDTENLVNLTANGTGILDASGVTGGPDTDEGRIRGNLTVTSTDPSSSVLTNLDLDEDGGSDDQQEAADGRLMTLVLPVDDVPDPTDDDANTVVDGSTYVGPDAEIALLGGSTLRLRGDAQIDGQITNGVSGYSATGSNGIYEDLGLAFPAGQAAQAPLLASRLFLEDNTVTGSGFIVVQNDDAGVIVDGEVTIDGVRIGYANVNRYDFQTDIVDSSASDVLTYGTGRTLSNGAPATNTVYGNIVLSGSLALMNQLTVNGDADEFENLGRTNLVRVGSMLELGAYDLFINFADEDGGNEAGFVDLTDATVTATTGYLVITADDAGTDGYRTRLQGDDTDIPNLYLDDETEINGGIRVTEIYIQDNDLDTEASGNQLTIADDVQVVFDDGARYTDLDFGSSSSDFDPLAFEGGINLRTVVGSQTSSASLVVAQTLVTLGSSDSDPLIYTFSNNPDLGTSVKFKNTQVGSIAEVGAFNLGQATVYVRDLVNGATAGGSFLNIAGHRVYTLGDVSVDGDRAIQNYQATGSCTGGGAFVPGRGCSTDPIAEIGFAGGDDVTLDSPSGETVWGQGVDIRIAKDEAEDMVSLTGGALAFDDVFDSLTSVITPGSPSAPTFLFGGNDEFLILQMGVLMAGETDNQADIYVRLDHENALNLGSSPDNGQGFVFANASGAFLQDDQAVERTPMSYVSGNVRKRIANSDVNVIIQSPTGDIAVAEITVAPGRVIFPTGETIDGTSDDADYAPFVFDFESNGPGAEFGTRTLSVTYVDETPGMNASLPLQDGTSGPGLIEGVGDFYWLVRTVGAALGQDTRFNIEARTDEYEITGSSDDIELVRRQFGDVAGNPYSGIGGDADVFQIDQVGSDEGDPDDDTVIVQESVTQSFLGPQGTLITFGLAVSTRPVANTPDSPTTPTEFAFHGNLPNPFNARTALTFDLPEAAEVSVEVFDVMGRRVLNVENQAMNAGAAQRVELDGTGLASGVYVFRLRAEGASETWTRGGQITLAR